MFLKRYSILIYIIIFVCLINIITLVYIKKTEFPFITLSYKNRPTDFNSSKLNLELPLSQGFKKRVSDDLGPLLEGRKEDVFFVSSTLGEYVRSHLFHKSNTIDNPDKILESQEEYPAICSGYSKFLVSLAQALGYQARVIWLDGHTTSEIYFPEYGWVLVDSSGNLIFQDESGKYVSLLYAVENFDKVIPKRIASQTNNDHDGLSSGGYLNYKENDIIVAIEGPRLFDFYKRTKKPLVLINYILGREDVAKGIQYIGRGRERLLNFRYSLIALVIFNISFLIIFICYLYVRNRRNSRLQK